TKSCWRSRRAIPVRFWVIPLSLRAESIPVRTRAAAILTRRSSFPPNRDPVSGASRSHRDGRPRYRMSDAIVTAKLNEMTYRVIKPLGTGAGSTILLISDKKAGGQRYALKIVKRQGPDDDIYISQARIEYAVTQRLSHPNIIKIYDYRIRRSWFRVCSVELLMKDIDGETLDEIEGPRMGPLVLIFNQVASAMVHMHRRDVFHGDIKPSNIMLTKNDQAKLIDFGTAWVRGEDKN